MYVLARHGLRATVFHCVDFVLAKACEGRPGAPSGSVFPQGSGLGEAKGIRNEVCGTQAVKLGEHRVIFTASIIPALNGCAETVPRGCWERIGGGEAGDLQLNMDCACQWVQNVTRLATLGCGVGWRDVYLPQHLTCQGLALASGLGDVIEATKHPEARNAILMALAPTFYSTSAATCAAIF